MKKRIVLIILFISIFVRAFAGEYVYWEDHKRSSSGKGVAHVKICYPKDFKDNATANDHLMYTMYGMLNALNNIDYDATVNTTEVHFSNGTFYRIVFFWFYNEFGSVHCFRGNVSWTEGTPLETISQSSNMFSYDTAYNYYQTQCNKYLNML